MKQETKRNKIKVSKEGKFLMTGLNKKERQNLSSIRYELCKKVGRPYGRCGNCVDHYIIALYNEEENEIHFVDVSSYSADPRAEIV
jgi:ribosomal protein L34E